ncbi:Sen15 protein-domain-containing protein [Phlyctochytrium arcticum]|nr:Sen15 protein-domain-containing protein [Phlyctochytrium arcticum]
MEDHPLYSSFILALKHSTTASCPNLSNAFTVFLDLRFGKDFSVVRPVYLAHHDLIVINVSQYDEEEDEKEVVLPLGENEIWTIESVSKMFGSIPQRDIPKRRSLIMGIVSRDATVVYYRIDDGLVPPASEEG